MFLNVFFNETIHFAGKGIHGFVMINHKHDVIKMFFVQFGFHAVILCLIGRGGKR